MFESLGYFIDGLIFLVGIGIASLIVCTLVDVALGRHRNTEGRTK